LSFSLPCSAVATFVVSTRAAGVAPPAARSAAPPDTRRRRRGAAPGPGGNRPGGPSPPSHGQLSAHRVEAHRRPAVECLEPRRAVGMAEGPVTDLAALPPCPGSHPV